MASVSKKAGQARVIFFTLFSFAAAAAAAPPKDRPWVEIRTPHFTVYSNGTEKQARQSALGFEEIRAVFSEDLPGFRTDSGAETIVLAVRDEDSMKALLPDYWKMKSEARPAGVFKKGWERDYAVIELDQTSEGNPVVYHEYVHKLLHLNFARLPLWLDEGLAEFFGNTQFEPDKTLIGVPSSRMSSLRRAPPILLQDVLAGKVTSPFVRKGTSANVFYGECWALVHFLMFGKDMGNGQKFFNYLHLLQTNVDTGKAFAQAFGDPAQLDIPFRQYLSQFAFPSFTTKTPIHVDDSTFTARPVSQAEIAAVRGGFYTAFGNMDLAKADLTDALAGDPRLALAHENMAFYDFREGRDLDALGQFQEASKLDPKDYLALYYQTMLENQGKTDAASLGRLNDALGNVLHLNLNFAPALVERSRLYARRGDLADALFLAQKAALLEPDRAGYHTYVAQLLLLNKDYAQAIAVASMVAQRWTGPDSAEALAVVERARQLGTMPATPEQLDQEKNDMEYASGTEAAEGTVVSATCDKPADLKLVLATPDKQLTFLPAKRFGVGWSDTVWYGDDHVNVCHHLDGMHVVVRYKAEADSKPPLEMNWLEVRNDVPVNSGAAPEQSQPGPQPSPAPAAPAQGARLPAGKGH